MGKESKDKSLTATAGLSAALQVGGGAISIIIRLGSSTVLARLLDPVDFGILGVGIIALEAIAHLGNLGISAGIISKKNLTETDLSTGFWILLCNRILLFLFCYISAPLIAIFFKEPRVTQVFRVCSIVFLLSAVDAIPRALITKKLDYKTLSLLQIGGSVFESGIAISLAAKTDLRYWALIYAMLATYGATLIVLYALTKWYPILAFSKSSLKYYKSFMMNGVGASVVLYLKNNIDYLIVGRILGVAKLGLYEFAYKVPNSFIVSFIMPLSTILHPLLAKIQDDHQAVSTGYLRAMRLIFIIAFPALLGLATVSDTLVPTLWGSKWLGIITPLKILCFAGIVTTTYAPIEFLFLAKQKPHEVFRMHCSTFFMTALAVLFLGYYAGLNGIALGMAIGGLPGLYFTARGCTLIGLDPRKFFLVAFEVFGLALFSTLPSLFITHLGIAYHFNTILNLALSILSATLTYLAVLRFFSMNSLNELIFVINETIGRQLIRPIP